MSFSLNPLTGKLDMVNPPAPLIKGTTQGQMSFYDATLGKWTYTENTEMFWDDTNKRMGIGTASPGAKLDVIGEIKENNRPLLRYNLLLN
jgi:hypothetical protein